MFEGRDYPKSLNEEVFNDWLEKGRKSKMGYLYLLIVWSEYDSEYQAIYTQDREEIGRHKGAGNNERMVAAYDLYSESRII